MKSNSQKGVALVITLIFLSVITFLAVTFLVVSRRGSEQVTTLTQQATAKNAADAALQQANAQISSLMFAQTNSFNFGLVVSTNFISSNFDNTGVVTAITNVSYQGLNGAALSASDLQHVLNNLLILPRPPVFISTNKAPNAPNEFRFYVDLNRNGVFDTNGVVPVLNAAGLPILDINNKIIPTNVVGDPEWIGILDHPDQRHSASNQFIARYAYIAVPIGNSLDINYIHNQAKQIGTNNDGFLRDQGVGSWEINLAGFLYALNPLQWSYVFYDTNTPPIQFPSSGTAFQDAAAIVAYRYGGNYNTLSSFNQMYNPANPNAGFLFGNDFIDGYSTGPLMNTLAPPTINSDPVNAPWSGADSTNQFFTTQDLFTKVPAPPGPALSFSNRLFSAGTNLSTANRYTFYNMLSQLSFGSAPDPTNKLDLNYENVNGFAATNFVPWRPLDFFTSAADRLLKTHTNFIIPIIVNGVLTNTNLSTSYIPIYPNNFYTPAVHRMLQLAANIYDASTNRNYDATSTNGFFPPSVFQPIFSNTVINGVTNIFIRGYQEVTNFAQVASKPVDLRTPGVAAVLQSTNNVYGVPLIVGVKKGFPNFNEFSMAAITQITRKMEITRPNTNTPPQLSLYHTNILYNIGISNTLAVECWNSYSNNYTRPVSIFVTNELSMWLTNDAGAIPIPTNMVLSNLVPVTTGIWPGTRGRLSDVRGMSNTFDIPFITSFVYVPDLILHQNPPIYTDQNTGFENTVGFPAPTWGLSITNRLRVVMTDTQTGRILDYVQLSGLDWYRNLTADLQSSDTNGTGFGQLWNTNRWGGTTAGVPTQGMVAQVKISADPTTASQWNQYGSGSSNEIAGFQAFMGWGSGPGVTNLEKQVPFTPTAKYEEYYTWQANDPLVHYTTGDLTDLTRTNVPLQLNPNLAVTNILPNLQKVNSPRYQPWNFSQSSTPGPIDPAYKDPLIRSSDDWQFPTNRYPNIGWLGRVHRGTPWQTVYMKSAPVDPSIWQNWTGSTNVVGGIINQIASTMEPTNDWAIFDWFTTAPNDNASRGQLSVNQTNFAAWAAILDGVIAVTNSTTDNDIIQNALAPRFDPLVIDPNVNGPALQQIMSDINARRAATVTNNGAVQPLYPGQVFTRLGDILSVPSLTLASPFLNTSSPTQLKQGLNDAAYERIPQQIMSLLRVGTPRYVIFAYGQSLKPADHSILTSGGPGILGMCTNYQITGEVATRTVVRFEPSGPINPADPYAPFNPAQNPVMPYRTNPNNSQPPVIPPQIPPPRAVIESFTVLPPE